MLKLFNRLILPCVLLILTGCVSQYLITESELESYLSNEIHFEVKEGNQLFGIEMTIADIQVQLGNKPDTMSVSASSIIKVRNPLMPLQAKMTTTFEAEPYYDASTHSIYLKQLKLVSIESTPEDIEKIMNFKYGNPAVLPVLQLLYPHLDYKNSIFHIDHIYPKSKFRDKNKKLSESYIKKADYLYNLQLLEGAENIAKKDKDPEIWLSTEMTAEKIKDYKNRNFINDDFQLEWEDIENFESMRISKIKTELESLFK